MPKSRFKFSLDLWHSFSHGVDDSGEKARESLMNDVYATDTTETNIVDAKVIQISCAKSNR
jgi:hypothetical protein